MSTRRHCTDDLLIAFADGEIAERDQRQVRLHLQECWQCRLRLKELEEAALGFTRALQDYESADPSRLVDARVRFEQRARADQRARSRVEHVAPSRVLKIGLALAACLAIGFIAFRQSPQGIADQAPEREILARLEAADNPPSQELIRQVFEVEIAEIRPAKTVHRRRLEIAVDPARERFESRLESMDGNLRHGLWRPRAGAELRYDSVQTRTPSPFVQAAHREGFADRLLDRNLTLNKLESALIQWLEQRTWTTVSLAHSMSLFAGEEGTMLAARRDQGAGGEEILQVVVRKKRGDIVVEAVLEADPDTFRPVVQTIRWYSRTRELEVRFRPFHPSEMRPVTFAPDLSLFARRVDAPPAPVPPVTFVIPPVPPPAAEPDPYLAERREIEVLYALHQARACLGEPIELVRGEAGSLLVRGVVRDEFRQEQVLAALGGEGIRPWLTADIRTTAEMFPGYASDAAPAAAFDPPGIRSAILARIEAYFAGRVDEPERAAREFRDAALRQGGALLSDALALGRIAERLRNAPRFGGDPEPNRLLNLMARDHARAVRMHALVLRGHLAPVLEEVFPELSSDSPSQHRGGGWASADASTAGVLDMVRRVYTAQLGVLSSGAGSAAPDRELAGIVADLLRIEWETQELAARFAALPAEARAPDAAPRK